jgi:hypothetical protein
MLGIGSSFSFRFQWSHTRSLSSSNVTALGSDGESGHSSSLASFKVPSALHASPSGFVGSLRCIFPGLFELDDESDFLVQQLDLVRSNM